MAFLNRYGLDVLLCTLYGTMRVGTPENLFKTKRNLIVWDFIRQVIDNQPQLFRR